MRPQSLQDSENICSVLGTVHTKHPDANSIWISNCFNKKLQKISEVGDQELLRHMEQLEIIYHTWDVCVLHKAVSGYKYCWFWLEEERRR